MDLISLISNPPFPQIFNDLYDITTNNTNYLVAKKIIINAKRWWEHKKENISREENKQGRKKEELHLLVRCKITFLLLFFRGSIFRVSGNEQRFGNCLKTEEQDNDTSFYCELEALRLLHRHRKIQWWLLPLKIFWIERDLGTWMYLYVCREKVATCYK